MKLIFFFIFILSSSNWLGYKLSQYALCEEPEPDWFTKVLGYFHFIEIKPACPSLESVLLEFLTDFMKIGIAGIVLVAAYVVGRIMLNVGLWKPICILQRLVSKSRVRKRDVQRKRKVRYQDRESLLKSKKSRRQAKHDVARVLKRVYNVKK